MSEVTFGGNTIGDKALYLAGVARGKQNEHERIIAIIESGKWASDSLKEDIENLKQLIKGEQK